MPVSPLAFARSWAMSRQVGGPLNVILLCVHRHQNLLVQTPPRTGKTVAMVMSALSIVDPDQQCPQILFVVPTIELMYQIGRLFLAAQKSYSKQIRMTFAENHYVDGMIVYEQIVVGLPKRLNGMIHAYLLDASKLRLVVFEEADLLMSETNRYLYYCNRIHTGVKRRDVERLLCPVAPTTSPIRDRVIPVPNQDPVLSCFQCKCVAPTKFHKSGSPFVDFGSKSAPSDFMQCSPPFAGHRALSSVYTAQALACPRLAPSAVVRPFRRCPSLHQTSPDIHMAATKISGLSSCGWCLKCLRS
ncbi:hypothetical protein PR048_013957 [Dryococelus australis]|uniref:Helicase ATP-binding domain-containing protein n=1 Tax=Dryococelus australis TaxID=614101 RepID=A0ABQ9HUJ7_9NEOP|nr:hypothetical protein PR048_013957 [Dryococelus australis]